MCVDTLTSNIGDVSFRSDSVATPMNVAAYHNNMMYWRNL